MRKTIKAAMATIMLVMVAAPYAEAYKFEYNGMYFEVTGYTPRTCQLTFAGEDWQAIPVQYTDATLIVPQTVSDGSFTYEVTAIGENALYGNEFVMTLLVPESVTAIGDRAFFDCKKLTTISLPETLTSIGENIAQGSPHYRDASNWLNGKVYCIGRYAICADKSITSSVLSPGTLLIADHCFADCDRLESVEMPQSVKHIGHQAFDRCTALASIELPVGLVEISDYMMQRCENLASVNIPDGVTSIGTGAFSECSSLAHISSLKKVESIGDYAFCNTGIGSVELGTGLKSVGDRAFLHCDNLKSVNIPGAETRMESTSFASCTSLQSITINSKNPYYKVVGKTVYDKSGATLIVSPAGRDDDEIVVPEGVVEIKDLAFSSHLALERVLLPSSLERIGLSSFGSCHKLAAVVCDAPTPPVLGNSVFQDVDVSSAELFVPEDAYYAYCRASQWGDFGYIKVLEQLHNGDLNSDYMVDARDVAYLIDLMLGVTHASVDPEAADLNGDGKVNATDLSHIISIMLGVRGETAVVAVDLGLSVRWSNCNVGTLKPHQPGVYFAWGEIQPKDRYITDNAFYYGLGSLQLQRSGIIDETLNLTAEYDAATAWMGRKWRMPTIEEIKELEEKCTWTLTTIEDVKGYEVTGPNGNCIFIPLAGYMGGSRVYGLGTSANLWSSTAWDDAFNACAADITSSKHATATYYRSEGFTIRPVRP